MKHPVVVITGILVLAGIAAQAYYSYRLSQRLDALSAAPPASSSPAAEESPYLGLPELPNPEILRQFRAEGARDPYLELFALQARVNRLFRQADSRLRRHPEYKNRFPGGLTLPPELDLLQTPDTYTLVLNMPGLDPGAISVRLEGRTLFVEGRVEQDDVAQGPATVLRRERLADRYRSRVTLPGPVAAAAIQNRYRHGVLTVSVPRKPE